MTAWRERRGSPAAEVNGELGEDAVSDAEVCLSSDQTSSALWLGSYAVPKAAIVAHDSAACLIRGRAARRVRHRHGRRRATGFRVTARPARRGKGLGAGMHCTGLWRRQQPRATTERWWRRGQAEASALADHRPRLPAVVAMPETDHESGSPPPLRVRIRSSSNHNTSSDQKSYGTIRHKILSFFLFISDPLLK
jgi:hypothetical protein